MTLNICATDAIAAFSETDSGTTEILDILLLATHKSAYSVNSKLC